MPDIFPTDVPLETVRAGLANTACILLIDAAQHVRRTTVIVEAATTMALQDSLTPGRDGGLIQSLNASQQAMTNALLAFNEMVSAAVGILKDDDGPRGGRRLALAAEGPVSGGGKAAQLSGTERGG